MYTLYIWLRIFQLYRNCNWNFTHTKWHKSSRRKDFKQLGCCRTISINCRTFTMHKNTKRYLRVKILFYLCGRFEIGIHWTFYCLAYRRKMLQDKCEKHFNESYTRMHTTSCKWTQHPLYEIQIGFFIPNKLGIGRHLHFFDYILKSKGSLIILYYVFCSIYGYNGPEYGVSCRVF